jgi:hypothetical protein
MAARATAPKLQVKYDAGLLKIKDFIEPLAQLRSHRTIKLKRKFTTIITNAMWNAASFENRKLTYSSPDRGQATHP